MVCGCLTPAAAAVPARRRCAELVRAQAVAQAVQTASDAAGNAIRRAKPSAGTVSTMRPAPSRTTTRSRTTSPGAAASFSHRIRNARARGRPPSPGRRHRLAPPRPWRSLRAPSPPTRRGRGGWRRPRSGSPSWQPPAASTRRRHPVGSAPSRSRKLRPSSAVPAVARRRSTSSPVTAVVMLVRCSSSGGSWPMARHARRRWAGIGVPSTASKASVDAAGGQRPWHASRAARGSAGGVSRPVSSRESVMTLVGRHPGEAGAGDGWCMCQRSASRTGGDGNAAGTIPVSRACARSTDM